MPIVESENLSIDEYYAPGSFEAHAAKRIAGIIAESVEKNGRANIALSGGSTPLPVFGRLLKKYKCQVPWDKVSIFWVDERCVAPNHKDSNFGTAYKKLIKYIPEVIAYRMRGEEDPLTAKHEYAEILRKELPRKNNIPEFDMISLGMGDDGHTASLFPGSDVLNEDKELVKEVWVEKLNAYRLTLTLPVLNNARNRVVLITGDKKVRLFNEIRGLSEFNYPIQHIYPARSQDYWLIGKF